MVSFFLALLTERTHMDEKMADELDDRHGLINEVCGTDNGCQSTDDSIETMAV